jgi:anti-sigma B factor antagonist
MRRCAAVEDFEVRRAGGVVTPKGEIDLATIDAVQVEIDAARAEAALVVLDLREVTFIDSAGIRLIVEAAREGEFAVVRGGPEVTRVFNLVGLGGRVPMLDAPPGE